MGHETTSHLSELFLHGFARSARCQVGASTGSGLIQTRPLPSLSTSAPSYPAASTRRLTRSQVFWFVASRFSFYTTQEIRISSPSHVGSSGACGWISSLGVWERRGRTLASPIRD